MSSRNSWTPDEPISYKLCHPKDRFTWSHVFLLISHINNKRSEAWNINGEIRQFLYCIDFCKQTLNLFSPSYQGMIPFVLIKFEFRNLSKP